MKIAVFLVLAFGTVSGYHSLGIRVDANLGQQTGIGAETKCPTTREIGVCGEITALQSSAARWEFSGYAVHAIDENKKTAGEENGCTHTGSNDPNPWLIIDLGCEKEIKKVKIINRSENAWRLRDFVVQVSDTLPDPDVIECNKVCLEHKGELPEGKNELACAEPLKGRYIFIRYRDPASIDSERIIHVCDVAYE